MLEAARRKQDDGHSRLHESLPDGQQRVGSAKRASKVGRSRDLQSARSHISTRDCWSADPEGHPQLALVLVLERNGSRRDNFIRGIALTN